MPIIPDFIVLLYGWTMKKYILQSKYIWEFLIGKLHGHSSLWYVIMQQEISFISKDKKIGIKLTVFKSTKQSFAIICLCGDVNSCLQDVKSKLTAWNIAADQPVFSSIVKNIIHIFLSIVIFGFMILFL